VASEPNITASLRCRLFIVDCWQFHYLYLFYDLLGPNLTRPTTRAR